MPDSNATITANYEDLEYKLQVIDGVDVFGSGAYYYTQSVPISADPPPADMWFARWEITSGRGSFGNASAADTTFTMSDADVVLTATYSDRPPSTPGGPGVPDPLPVDLILQARKTVTGDNAVLEAGLFSFAAYEGSRIIATGTNDAGGYIGFSPITFTQEGIYTYKIVETTPDSKDWLTDTREYTATVTVTDRSGELTAKVEYSSVSIPLFRNRYVGEAPPIFTMEPHYSYIVGYPDGTVGPHRSITRAEVATVFYRLMDEATREENLTRYIPFPDVAAGAWYFDAIAVMANMQKVYGYPDGTYKPNGAITRAELAAIVARFGRQMGMTPSGGAHFSDIGGHWAQADITYVAEVGWVEGYPDGTYRPNQNITRAEFMTIVNRMMERVPETANDLLPDEMIRWVDNSNPDTWYYIAIQEATNSHIPDYKESRVRGLQFQYEYWLELIENPVW